MECTQMDNSNIIATKPLFPPSRLFVRPSYRQSVRPFVPCVRRSHTRARRCKHIQSRKIKKWTIPISVMQSHPICPTPLLNPNLRKRRLARVPSLRAQAGPPEGGRRSITGPAPWRGCPVLPNGKGRPEERDSCPMRKENEKNCAELLSWQNVFTCVF